MIKKNVKESQKRILVSDCEGPISKNDNAFELANYFIPRGDRVFALISKYDDVLADVVKRANYKAGDTLRLILPLLKAYGATNGNLKKFSSEHVLLVPGAVKTLQFVRRIMPTFIVSTSYEQYMLSICDLVDFPFENVYCTRLNMDRYEASEKEKKRLKELCVELSEMSMIDIPEMSISVGDFSTRDQNTIRRLDEIFLSEISGMKAGRMLQEVTPVGGYEKTKAIQNVVEKLSSRPSNVMYVGDSITDVSPFKWVRKSGGLTISFNGNKYAIREAEIAVLSKNTIVTSILAYTFNNYGTDETCRLVKEWGYPVLKRYVEPTLYKQFVALFPNALPQVETINNENKERLTRESGAFRKTVRGETVGVLG